jgi:hypothetical protein
MVQRLSFRDNLWKIDDLGKGKHPGFEKRQFIPASEFNYSFTDLLKMYDKQEVTELMKQKTQPFNVSTNLQYKLNYGS